MKKDIENLSEWIKDREMRGYYTFTKEDIEKQFPSLGKDYMKTYLSRLVAKAKIISPWRNFYVIMPIEYSLKGIVPPVFYIDQLMAYLQRLLCIPVECRILLWRIPSKGSDILGNG